MCGEGVPYGDYPASEEKFMSMRIIKYVHIVPLLILLEN